jgi:hypothetical protein
MIQALDLARENAALKHEAERLRKELGEFVQTNKLNPTESSGSFIVQWLHGPGIDHAALASSADARIAVRLVLVMPRDLALDCGLLAGRFAGLSQCSVIVDRRIAERRHGPTDYRGHERRQLDRRSDHRNTILSVLALATCSEIEPCMTTRRPACASPATRQS